MSGLQKIARHLPFAISLTGISFAFGFIVPTLFEMGEKLQARSRHPEMEIISIAVLAVFLIAAVLVRYFARPKAAAHDKENQGVHDEGNQDEGNQDEGNQDEGNQDEGNQSAQQPLPFRFTLRGMFILMTLVAAFFGLVNFVKLPYPALTATLIAFGIVGWSFRSDWQCRWNTVAMLSVMYLPFSWMIAYNEPFGHTIGLLEHIPVAPAMIPSMLTGAIATQDDRVKISALIVIAELFCGAWLLRRGGKLSVVFIVGLMLLSFAGTMILHALYRA